MQRNPLKKLTWLVETINSISKYLENEATNMKPDR
jgi:hypothetical protein